MAGFIANNMRPEGAGPDVSDLYAAPELSTPQLEWGTRGDGSAKGVGYLGVLRTIPDASTVASEYSIEVEIDGKPVEIPTLVPTLTRPEVEEVLRAAGAKDGKLSPSIINKAVDFAASRLKEGRGVFAEPGEAPADTRAMTANPRMLDYAQRARSKPQPVVPTSNTRMNLNQQAPQHFGSVGTRFEQIYPEK